MARKPCNPARHLGRRRSCRRNQGRRGLRRRASASFQIHAASREVRSCRRGRSLQAARLSRRTPRYPR